MLDKNKVYSMPGETITPMVKSYMKTFMISIRRVDSLCGCVKNFYVSALSAESALLVGDTLVNPSGYVVEDVVSPGAVGYGVESTCECSTDSDGNTTSYPNGNVF